MLANQKRKKPLVFLSYSHTDFDEASKLREDITEAEIDVWWDRDILPGQDWKYELQKAMQGSDAVILCLSNNALERKKICYLHRSIGSDYNIQRI